MELELSDFSVNHMKFHTTEVDGTHSRTMLLPFKMIFSGVTLNPEASSTPVEVQAFRAGSWDHPMYGKVNITPQTFSNMVNNYEKKVYNQDLSITYEHGLDRSKGLQAAGWVRKVVSDLNTVLSYSIEFTKEAMEEIKAGKWRYFSPEYQDEYTDPETKQVYHDVLVGGSLTNAPFFKGMQPLNFSEIFSVRELKTEIEIKPIEGGGNMNFRDKLVRMASELGIAVPTDAETDEALEARCFSALATQRTELEPLRKLREATQGARTFAEQFPEQAKKMAEMEARDLETQARAFSETFGRIMKSEKIEDSETETKQVSTTLAFSALVQEKMKTLYKKFSEGTATPEDLTQAFSLIASGDGIVDLGEKGSSVSPETGIATDDENATSVQEARQLFSTHVKAVQARPENKDKQFSEVLAIAANEKPKLFELYQAPVFAGKN